MFKQTLKFCLIAFFVAVFSSISLALLAQEQTQWPVQGAPSHIQLSVTSQAIAKLELKHWQKTSNNPLLASFATAPQHNVVNKLFWQSLNNAKLLLNNKHQYQHNINNWFLHQLSIKQQLNVVLNSHFNFYSLRHFVETPTAHHFS